jgi:hypothetical protein
MARGRVEGPVLRITLVRQPESFVLFDDFDGWLTRRYYGAGISDRVRVSCRMARIYRPSPERIGTKLNMPSSGNVLP